ncbi:MAG: hypothetical protein DCC67_17385 [Planctomycetota bacterium]|nr:MAG: hypothetical protein DCC67_17385 [Planctomycetota bacterium]
MLVVCSSIVAPPLQAVAAGVIVDAAGFETFAAGALEGQQNWVAAGASASTATVQSSIVRTGAKAVAVARAANADRRWARPVSGYPTGRYVVIDWDMRVAPTGAGDDVFGPFFGVEAYDATNAIGLLGSLGVDATTGDVLYQTQDDGFLAETGAKATFNAWNSFRILLDFASDKYGVYFNGSPLATTGFVDRSLNLNHFTDADVSTFAAAFDAASLAQPGVAYFDSFRVWESLPGDFNFDGAVNNADLTIWRSSVGGSAADADADGDSDGVDFLIWQRNAGGNVLAAATVASAVPEPATATLGLATLAAALRLRRRARRAARRTSL